MLKKLWNIFFGTRDRAMFSGLVCFALVSEAELLIMNDVSIDVFYLLPLFIFTWFGSLRRGILISVAGLLVWLLDERLGTPGIMHHIHILVWNSLVRLSVFAVTAVLLDRIKQLLAKEHSVSKLKSTMIHTVSHEFNNALTGLSAGLFLLKETDQAAGDATRAQLYSAMEASQHKLLLYVKNILNEARMEEGRFRIEKRPLALRELAEGAAESLSDLLQQKKLRLVKAFPEKPLLVDADYEALSLVISNILGNSVKYTREGGRIQIKVEESGDNSKVIFSVSDTGIGISLEDMEKITSGFYRTQESQSEAAGFGLGLRITNELLGLHGSTLQISSEKGKGSRFFFELPVYRPAPERGWKA